MGWIEWTGGAMPVDGDTEVVIMTAAGRIVEGKARDFEWELSGSRHDIIVYRLQTDADLSLDMNALAPISADSSELVATIERARTALSAGDVQAALLLSSGAYEQAKAAGAYAEKVKASRELIDKARRMQADALKIESLCYVAMADAVDEAQVNGKLSRGGRQKTVHDEDRFTLEEVGIDKRRLHEARSIRNAERAEPGFIERVVEARLDEGLEPSRAGLKRAAGHAIGTKTATKEERGVDLNETPIEAIRTLLALESFSGTVEEPSVGKGAILRPLEAAGYDVRISDLVDRGIATQHGELQRVGDFLTLRAEGEGVGADIVTNPPYGIANAYIAHALKAFRPGKMALLLNLNFLAGFDDPDRCFVMDENPPSRVYVFTRRLPMMHRDGWEGKKASSQMNTGWFIWERNEDGSYGSEETRVIRVDWARFADAPALLPGAGGNVSPAVVMGPVVDVEFARETPRRTMEERLDAVLNAAIDWMSCRDGAFDEGMIRRQLGIRSSTAAAVIERLQCEGRIVTAEGGYVWAGDVDYRARPDDDGGESKARGALSSPGIARDENIDALLASDAPVAIGVSGGKDSQAAALATFHHLDSIGHAGPRILIHADLGIVEWDDSLRICEELADHLKCDLVVVRRKAGGLMERWESRWLSSKTRYEMLSTITLVPCWSTPDMRFCTSEQKTHVITAELKRRYKGKTIVNVTGVRREESRNRARMPVADGDGPIVNWRPIIDHTTEEVFSAIDRSGLQPHPAYRQFGMSRVSCRFCIMSNIADMTAASAQPESHDLYRKMVQLEIDSSFAFQGARWLGDVAPHLLSEEMREALGDARHRAILRKDVEGQITKPMLYVKGWPTRMLTDGEAEILASVRGKVSSLYGFKSQHLTVDSIHERYAALIADRDRKEGAP